MGKALEDALAAAKKSGLRIAPLSEHDLEVEAISTGNLSIDHITCVGGLPRGRITELYGPPASGKTSTALQTAVSAQRAGLTVCYLDYEQSIDLLYCKRLGLDIDAPTFLFGQPDSFEQGMNAARDIIKSGEIGMTIFDSVGAMATEKELSVDTGASTFADKAKLMAQSMRQLTPVVASNNVVCVFLNHLHDVIDTSPMGQQLAARGVKRTNTPGGRALKFHASMRIEFKQLGGVRTAVQDDLANEMQDIVTAQKVQVTVVKNKVGPPFKTCEVRARFGRGLSPEFAILNILTSYGVIRKEKGGVYRFYDATQPDFQKNDWIKGEEVILQAMEAHPEWTARLQPMALSQLAKVTPDVGVSSIQTTAFDDEDLAPGADELLGQ